MVAGERALRGDPARLRNRRKIRMNNETVREFLDAIPPIVQGIKELENDLPVPMIIAFGNGGSVLIFDMDDDFALTFAEEFTDAFDETAGPISRDDFSRELFAALNPGDAVNCHIRSNRWYTLRKVSRDAMGEATPWREVLGGSGQAEDVMVEIEPELIVATDFLAEVAAQGGEAVTTDQVLAECHSAIERLGLTKLFNDFRDARAD
ncbi:hypothetical protein GR702_11490 [Novosphingobium sp. FGD1]|uniref:Uncharacterized protein n=1 Tax=Novosphingobium silvae TaxID=2692619 RepID=A0A7X4GHM1_9SPHN|nr:hypothetical protein [Novosphingobium silvae]MYL98386.1 hypothetical protein [Novosphingobium silvae]